MDREISPSHLKAFLAVARLGSISQAAKSLFVTQPAISVRIKRLEDELKCQLFRRDRKGIQLTDAGYRLLKYSRIRLALEDELFSVLDKKSERVGTIKIAGHFSIINHVAIPALADYLRTQPEVSIETVIREDDELPEVLQGGQAEFVFLQKELGRSDFESHFLGSERYVLIESTKYKTRQDTFIDSEPSDVITEEFRKLQKGSKGLYKRSFLHDESGIARGVALGLGRAIVAEREIGRGLPVRIVPGLNPLLIPSYLHFARQSYFTPLELETREALLSKAKNFLA